MLLSKPIRFLFFMIFKWQTAVKPDGNPTVWSTVIVTVLLSLNVLVVIQLLLWRSGPPIFRAVPNLARLLGYFCFVVVGGLIWMSLVRSGTYTRLGQEFATASERRQAIRKIAFASYLVVSLCMPFILKVLLHNARVP
jgi:hypothetical protein